ncbi:MAG TPA: ABC transporter permease [Candidatus Binatia bacterium]|nr:ABC transporter permease [Candidatus Binatia bacterium]
MAETQEEVLLDVKVAEASWLYKFYLNHERKILGTVSVTIFLLLWEFMGGPVSAYNPIPILRVNPMFMSAPSLTWKAAVDLFRTGDIWNDLYVSSVEFAGGYLLSVAVAIPLGVLIGWNKKASAVFDPFVNAMNATPRVALLPLVIIWLGIGIMSKVGIIFLGAVVPIIVNARDGVKTTPSSLLNAARSFGATEWQVFKSVVMPSTLPFILSGLRIALGRALVGVMVGELYAATAGIGFMITVAGATFQTDKVFVGVLIFAISGMLGMEALSRIEHHFDKWRPRVGAQA